MDIPTNTSIIHGREANADWVANGLPTARDLIGRAGLSQDGWRIRVTGLHAYGGGNRRPGRTRYRVGADRPAEHRVAVKTWPDGGAYQWEFDLVAPTTLGNWDRVVFLLRAAADSLSGVTSNAGLKDPDPVPDPAPDQAAIVPVAPPTVVLNGQHPPPVPVPPEVVALDAGIGQLEQLRAGLDAVLAVTRDAKAGVALRAEIAARVDALVARHDPLVDRLRDLHTRETAAVAHRAVAEKAIVDYRKALGAAEADLAKTLDTINNLGAEVHAAEAELAPLEADLAAARAELAEADAMEERRRAEVGKADDVAVLLEALARLTGTRRG